VVGEVAVHLEEVIPHHVHRNIDVRRAQIRGLLGRITEAATDLVQAGEAVEDRVDAGEGGGNGS
jgi:hypothetical protein